MATTYKLFDEYIELDLGDNYWGDIGVVYADQLLADFSEDDWTQLRSEAEIKSKECQYRCADALGCIDTINALEALVALLNVDDRGIVFTALCSINSIASMGMDVFDFSNRINAEVEKLRVNASQFEIATLDQLSRRLHLVSFRNSI